jgi:hypothetical protein
MDMRKATKTAILLTAAVSLVIVWASPVGAGKPSTNETVKVTMARVAKPEPGGGLAEGLTTDCDDGDGANGYLLMTRDRAGLAGGPSAVALGVFMNDVVWRRGYPESFGVGLNGCHGETVDGSPVENSMYGGLGINIDRSGAVTGLLWHFDYYLDGEYVTDRRGRVRFQPTVREYFTLSGSDLYWNDNTSTVSGWFRLSRSLFDANTEIGYQEFCASESPCECASESPESPCEQGSPQWMEFTLTFEP